MGASQADVGLSLAETEIVQLRHWPVFFGIHNSCKKRLFRGRGSPFPHTPNRLHTVHTKMSAMTMSASLTKVAVPTQGRKTVARRGAVKVQANMWPVS